MRSTRKYRHLLLVLLCLACLNLSGCLNNAGGGGDEAEEGSDTVGAAPVQNPVNPAPATPVPPPNTPDPQMIAAEVVNVGVLSFEQINSTFSVLTGMDPNQGSIRSLYEDVKSSLPLDNNIKNFSATTQTAAVKLAAQYCFEAIRQNRQTLENPAVRGRAFVAPGFNFNEAPSNVDASERAGLVKTILDNFWQRDPAGSANADDTEFENLFLLLVNGENNDNTTTRNAAVGVCTAILSNANVIMN